MNILVFLTVVLVFLTLILIILAGPTAYHAIKQLRKPSIKTSFLFESTSVEELPKKLPSPLIDYHFLRDHLRKVRLKLNLNLKKYLFMENHILEKQDLPLKLSKR